jgi:hypothetical protein
MQTISKVGPSYIPLLRRQMQKGTLAITEEPIDHDHDKVPVIG